jgi:hypothetical protein
VATALRLPWEEIVLWPRLSPLDILSGTDISVMTEITEAPGAISASSRIGATWAANGVSTRSARSMRCSTSRASAHAEEIAATLGLARSNVSTSIKG